MRRIAHFRITEEQRARDGRYGNEKGVHHRDGHDRKRHRAEPERARPITPEEVGWGRPLAAGFRVVELLIFGFARLRGIAFYGRGRFVRRRQGQAIEFGVAAQRT